MRTTIDGAGRVVIPKPVRDEAGLEPGVEIEVELRDGRVELTPVAVPMRLARGARGPTIEPEGDMPTLTGAEVRVVLERARR